MFIDDYVKLIAGLSNPISEELFCKTNHQVEKCSEFIYFIVFKVSPPAYVLPKAFFSLFLYFTTDMGQDAFMLPLPTWFVYKIYWLSKHSLSDFFHYHNLKVTLQLEKSDRVFDGGHHTIRH